MLENNYPKDWSTATIKNLTQRFLNGGTPSTHINEYWDGDIPWITGADAEQRVTITSRKTITELGVKRSSTNIVPKGNILLVTRTGVGKVSMAGVDVAISQDLTGIIPRVDLIDVPYLYYQLAQIASDLKSFAQGSIIQGIKREQVEAIEIPLPELTEQRVIAEILSTLDESIAKSESLVRKYQSLKQGLMSDLLTRGVDENGELRDAADTIDALYGYIPRRWRHQLLGEIAVVGNGVTLGRKVSGSDTAELPYLRVANVKDGYLDLSEIKQVRVYKAEVDRYLLQPGDVLMTEGGDFDKLGRGTVWEGQIKNCLHQNHIFRVRVNRKVLHPKFLSFVTGSPYGKRFFVLHSKQTTNLASINSTQIKSFPVPLPELDEQERILAIADGIDETIDKEARNLVKLNLLKQGLMQDLLSGQVRVKV